MIKTLDDERERGSSLSALPSIPEKGDPSAAIYNNADVRSNKYSNADLNGKGNSNLLAYASDLERAAKIVTQSPYNKFSPYQIPTTLTQR